MRLELSKSEARKIVKEWDKIPKKYKGFTSRRYQGPTDNFKCKYPALRNLIKRLEIEV